MDSLALCTIDSVVFPWMILNSLSCILQFIEMFGWMGVWCLMSEVFQPYKCFLLSSYLYMYACLFIGQCKICSIYGETTLFLLFNPFNEGCLQLLHKKITRENQITNFDNYLSFWKAVIIKIYTFVYHVFWYRLFTI